MAPAAWVVLGRIAGAFGVRGWVRVEPYTEAREGILDYPTWWLGEPEDRHPHELLAGRAHGRGVVAAVAGIADREAAQALAGTPVAVPRAALPATDGYYWADLVGLAVENREGRALGRITGFLPAGDHDVIVVAGAAGETLIPYAPGRYVDEVSLEQRRMVVNWHGED